MAIDMKILKVNSFFGVLELEIASMLLCGYMFALGVFSIVGSVISFDQTGFSGLIFSVIFAIVVWLLSTAAIKGIINRTPTLILCGVIGLALITLVTVISIFTSIPDLKKILTALILSVAHGYFMLAFNSHFMSIKSPTDVSGV